MAYPHSSCVVTPTANRPAKRAGEKARSPLVMDRASAFRVPRVRGLGETSLRASWMAVNDMLTPTPMASVVGAMIQKAVAAAGVPTRRSRLNKGQTAKKTG